MIANISQLSNINLLTDFISFDDKSEFIVAPEYTSPIKSLLGDKKNFKVKTNKPRMLMVVAKWDLNNNERKLYQIMNNLSSTGFVHHCILFPLQLFNLREWATILNHQLFKFSVCVLSVDLMFANHPSFAWRKKTTRRKKEDPKPELIRLFCVEKIPVHRSHENNVNIFLCFGSQNKKHHTKTTPTSVYIFSNLLVLQITHYYCVDIHSTQYTRNGIFMITIMIYSDVVVSLVNKLLAARWQNTTSKSFWIWKTTN